MIKALRKLRAQFDWTLAGAMLLVILLGLVNLYSATRVAPKGIYSQQLAWYALGIVAFVAAAAIDYRVYERLAPFAYVICLVLLVAVKLVGKNVNGSRRWLGFGPIAIQPSELAKVGVLLLLAKFTAGEPQALRARGLPHYFGLLVALLVPVGLVLYEPDLGTAGVLYIIGLSVILFAPSSWQTKLAVFLIAPAMASVRLAFGLKAYQLKRLHTFLDPQSDPAGAGYHARQSVLAIGSGRWTGKGFLHGTQNQLQFLPEHWSDFPFAVWAEEWGLVGSGVLLAVYLFLTLWALGVSASARDRFGQMLAFGVAALLFWQTVINVGMVAGVLPVVGVTLPLFSSGGSSLMTVMIALGLLMNVSIRRYAY